MIKNKKGYSLIELMIVMVFIVMAAGVVCLAFVQGLRMFYAEDRRMSSFVNAASVLDGMVMDLRHATSFGTRTASNLIFVKNGVSIAYSYDNGAKILYRTESGNTVALLDGVENLLFSYDSPTNTKYVSVIMTLKNMDNVITTFESGGGPRNL